MCGSQQISTEFVWYEQWCLGSTILGPIARFGSPSHFPSWLYNLFKGGGAKNEGYLYGKQQMVWDYQGNRIFIIGLSSVGVDVYQDVA